MPAGFMVTSTPNGAGDVARSGVNIVSVAQWRDSTDRGPAVVLVVYAYGEGEASGARDAALDARYTPVLLNGLKANGC